MSAPGSYICEKCASSRVVPAMLGAWRGACQVFIEGYFLPPSAPVDALVCGECGHVELRVPDPGVFYEAVKRKQGHP